jgi:hypothetical protein
MVSYMTLFAQLGFPLHLVSGPKMRKYLEKSQSWDNMETWRISSLAHWKSRSLTLACSSMNSAGLEARTFQSMMSRASYGRSTVFRHHARLSRNWKHSQFFQFKLREQDWTQLCCEWRMRSFQSSTASRGHRRLRAKSISLILNWKRFGDCNHSCPVSSLKIDTYLLLYVRYRRFKARMGSKAGHERDSWEAAHMRSPGKLPTISLSLAKAQYA